MLKVYETLLYGVAKAYAQRTRVQPYEDILVTFFMSPLAHAFDLRLEAASDCNLAPLVILRNVLCAFLDENEPESESARSSVVSEARRTKTADALLTTFFGMVMASAAAAAHKPRRQRRR